MNFKCRAGVAYGRPMVVFLEGVVGLVWILFLRASGACKNGAFRAFLSLSGLSLSFLNSARRDLSFGAVSTLCGSTGREFGIIEQTEPAGSQPASILKVVWGIFRSPQEAQVDHDTDTVPHKSTP